MTNPTTTGAPPPGADEVAARLAIQEVIYRYSRALDRMDREMALSCWHPDGTDDHAPLYEGSAAGFIDWLWPVHAAMTMTRHVVTNSTIVVDGDTAGSETYWSVTLRIPRDEGEIDVFSGGRYIDRFEFRDGVWAIQHRQAVRDWQRVDPVVPWEGEVLITPTAPHLPGETGQRDRSDASYQVLGD